MADDVEINVGVTGLALFVLSILGLIGAGYGGWDVVAGKTDTIPLKFWVGMGMIAFNILAATVLVAIRKWNGDL